MSPWCWGLLQGAPWTRVVMYAARPRPPRAAGESVRPVLRKTATICKAHAQASTWFPDLAKLAVDIHALGQARCCWPRSFQGCACRATVLPRQGRALRIGNPWKRPAKTALALLPHLKASPSLGTRRWAPNPARRGRSAMASDQQLAYQLQVRSSHVSWKTLSPIGNFPIKMELPHN